MPENGSYGNLKPRQRSDRSISPLIDRFCAEYHSYQAIKRPRALEQRNILARYQAFLGDVPIEQAGAAELKGFMAQLLDSGLTPNSIMTYRNMIRPFYAWAWENEIVGADTYMRIQRVEAPRGAVQGKPNPYKRVEIAQLWLDLDRAWPTTTELSLKRWERGTSSWNRVWRHAMHLQTEAIVSLALFCGLRRIEIRRLGLDDVHWDNAYIPVHGKNDKHREVPFDPAAAEACQAWLRFRKKMGPRHRDLWLCCLAPYSRHPMNARRYRDIVRFSKLESSLDDYRLHRLRHTCATERLRKGMSLAALQRYLGHANIQQTLRYAELINDDVARAADATNEGFHQALGRNVA